MHRQNNIELMEELWQFIKIKGEKITHEISTWGRARDAKTKEYVPQYCNEWGRNYVEINNRKLLVDRLVAIAFIPNPDHYTIVRHRNNNINDNKVENLKWQDVKEKGKDERLILLNALTLEPIRIKYCDFKDQTTDEKQGDNIIYLHFDTFRNGWQQNGWAVEDWGQYVCRISIKTGYVLNIYRNINECAAVWRLKATDVRKCCERSIDRIDDFTYQCLGNYKTKFIKNIVKADKEHWDKIAPVEENKKSGPHVVVKKIKATHTRTGTVMRFDSAPEAARKTGTPLSTIQARCNKNLIDLKGWYWEYEKD